jgi:hypothetical protein
MLAHPMLTLERSVIKFFNFWQLEREIVAGASRGYWGIRSQLAVVLLAVIVFASYSATLVSGIFGFMLSPPADLRLHWFLLLLAAFVCAIHSLVFAHSRYHLPLMPLVAIYAAAALAAPRRLRQGLSSWAGAMAILISLALVISWACEIAIVDLAHVRELLS